MPVVADTWPKLVEAARSRRDEDAHVLRRDASIVPKLLERPAPALALVFVNSPDPLARMLATSGVDGTRKHFHLLDPALAALLRHGDQGPRQAPASSLHAISYCWLARCVDLPLPDEAAALEARWLSIIAEQPNLLNEWGRRTAVLASAALGLDSLIPPLDGGGAMEPRTTSRDVAGPNVFGLGRHMAEVLLGGGRWDAVASAWQSFFRAFPLTLACEGVSWIDLVWAQSVRTVRFEAQSVAAVGRALSVHVTELGG